MALKGSMCYRSLTDKNVTFKDTLGKHGYRLLLWPFSVNIHYIFIMLKSKFVSKVFLFPCKGTTRRPLTMPPPHVIRVPTHTPRGPSQTSLNKDLWKPMGKYDSCSKRQKASVVPTLAHRQHCCHRHWSTALHSSPAGQIPESSLWILVASLQCRWGDGDKQQSRRKISCHRNSSKSTGVFS